jgi:hypothetical protein
MALESTQPQTEMSTGIFPGVKVWPVHKADNLTMLVIVKKMWEPQCLQSYRPPWSVIEIALLPYFIIWRCILRNYNLVKVNSVINQQKKKRCMNINIVFFWDVRQCNLVEGYQHFWGTCCLHLQGSTDSSSIFYHEDGGSRFLVNVGSFLPAYTASHPIIFITGYLKHHMNFYFALLCCFLPLSPVFGPQLYDVWKRKSGRNKKLKI